MEEPMSKLFPTKNELKNIRRRQREEVAHEQELLEEQRRLLNPTDEELREERILELEAAIELLRDQVGRLENRLFVIENERSSIGYRGRRARS
jgi:hypothetical protein